MTYNVYIIGFSNTMNFNIKIFSLLLFLLWTFATPANAANRYFKSGATNWNNANSWSATSSAGVDNAGVPTSVDIAYFDASSGNCSIDVNVNVLSINTTGYTGTLTQNGFTISVGASGWAWAGGTFVGGTNTISVIGAGSFNLSSGTFTSTSGTFNVHNFNLSGGTWNHNNGTVRICSTGGSTITNGNFYNLILDQATVVITITNNSVVANNFTLTGCGSASGSNIEVRGNIVFNYNANLGSPKVIANGTGNQTVSGTGSCGFNFEVNKASGTLTFTSDMSFQKDYLITAGTVDWSTFKATFLGNANSTVTNGSFYDLTLVKSGYSLTLTNTCYVSRDLLVTTIGSSSGSNIEVARNITLNSTNLIGSNKIIANGPSNQTVSGTGSCGLNFEINKSSGTLSFTSNVAFERDYTLTAGTVDWGTYTATFKNNWNSVITNGLFYDLTINKGTYNTTFTNVCTVNRNLLISGMSTVSGSNIELKGDVTFNSSNYAGSVVFVINGTANQNISGTGGCPASFQVNKSSGVVNIGSNLLFYNSYTITSGAVNWNTYKATFSGGVHSTITNASFYDLEIFKTAYNLTIATIDIVVSHDLTLNTTTNINGLNIYFGNSLICTGAVTGGSSKILPASTGNQSTSGTASVGVILEINKASGQIDLGANYTGSNTSTSSINLIAGTVNQNAYTITISKDMNISGGTFNGSASSITITGNLNITAGTFIGVSGNITCAKFIQTGGVFTSTSGTFQIGVSGSNSTYSLDITDGIFNHNNGLLKIFGANHSAMRNLESYPLYNVEVNQCATCDCGGTIYVDNNFLMTSNSNTLLYSVVLKGNYTSTLGAANVTFVGTNTQTVSGAKIGTVVISKPSGAVVLGSNMVVTGAGYDLIVNDGDLNLNGYNVTVPDLFTINDKLQLKGNETITVNSIVAPATNVKFSFSSGSTVEFTDSAVIAVLTNLTKTYYNLILGAGKTHEVATGASNGITINGTISSAGSSANRSVLRSVADAAVTWELTLGSSGSSILDDKVDVKYSNASSGLNVWALGSVDSTNNTNWNFATYPNFTWTGASDNNWNNTGNWVGGAVPGSTDIATFVGTYNVNCNINANVNVKGINVVDTYTGTITQGAFTIAVGVSNLVFSGGTFVGSASNITTTGSFRQEGGTFTSTSGTLTTAGFTLDGGVYNANGGIFSGTTYKQNGGTYNGSTNTFTLSSTFIQSGGTYTKPTNTFTGTSIAISGGVFNGTSGNINLTLSFIQTGGTATSTTGNMQLPGTSTTVFSTSNATFFHNNGTVTISGANNPLVFTNANNRLYHLTYTSTASIGGTNIYVDGNLNVGSAGTIGATAIFLKGNYSGTLGAVSGSSIITFNGTGDQSFAAVKAPRVIINKPSGNLIINSNIIIGSSWTHTQGAIVWNNYSASFEGPSGGIVNGVFYDLILNTANDKAFSGNHCVVANNFTLTNVGLFTGPNCDIKVGGNVVFTDPTYTNSTVAQKIILNGTGAQSISGTGPCQFHLEINKPSGIAQLGANLTVALAANKDLTITSGELYLNGYNLTVDRNLTVNGKLSLKGNETITVSTIVAPATNAAFTINSGSTIEFKDSAVTGVVSNVTKTFHHLILGAGKTHEFATGTGNRVTVNGALSSTGSSANRSVLRSIADAAATWELKLNGTSALADKVNVKYSDASSGNSVNAFASIDSGNNTNWLFSTFVTSVSSATANGTYTVGNTIGISMTFNIPVTITGTPTLTLETGSTDRVVSYVSGSTTNTLLFNYTVQTGDASLDLDYVANNSFALAGGTIKNSLGDDAILTLPNPGASGSLGSNKNLVIDTTAPTITSITSSTSNGSYKAGGSISVRINFSEPITLVGTMNINLDSGGVVAISAFVGTSATGTYTVLTGHNSLDLAASSVTLTSTARDVMLINLDTTLPVTNISTASNIVIDTTLPTITSITSSTPNGSYKAGYNISVNINFSEQITVVGTLNVNLDTGGVVAISAFTGTTATGTYTVQGGHTSSDLTASSVTITNTVRDAALNDLSLTLPGINIATGSDIVIDTTAPTITSITSSTLNGSFKAGDTIPVRINFSEQITVVGTMSVNLDSGGVAAISAFTGTTATGIYTVQDGHTSSDLTASSVTITNTARDLALNNLDLTLPGINIATNSNIVIDTAIPTITSISSSTPNGSYSTGANISIRVNFSKAITLTGTMSVNLDSGGICAISAFVGTTATGIYTVLIGQNSSDLTATSIVVNGTARDSALNNLNTTLPGTNIATNSNIVIDTTIPSVTSIQSLTASGYYRAGQAINIIVSFSEPVTLSNGTLSMNLTSGGTVLFGAFSGTSVTGVYTVLVGENTLTLNATSVSLTAGTLLDGSLNATSMVVPSTNISPVSSIVVDTIAPLIDSHALGAGNVFLDITFAEGVYATNTGTGSLNTSDFTLVFAANGGSATNVTIASITNTSGGALVGGESTYRLVLSVTGFVAGLETITVNPNSNEIFDKSGNPAPNTTSTGVVTLFDQVAPTVSNITSSKTNAAYTAGVIIDIQIAFTEAVTVTGTPTIKINNGGAGINAAYVSGSTTNTLVFNYIVVTGDNNLDLDYMATTSLALSGGTILDVGGNAAALVLPTPGASGSLGFNKALIIDTVVPTIVSGTLEPTNAYVDITLSEGVYTTGSIAPISVNDFQLTFIANGGVATGVTITSLTKTTGGALSGGDTVIRAMISVSGFASGVETIKIQAATNKIFDKAGNAMLATPVAGPLTLVKMGTTPIISKVYSVSSNGTYGLGQTISIAVQFSESVSVTGIPYLQLETGTQDQKAFYSSNLADDTLLFTYTVSANDISLDLDYLDTSSLISGLNLINSALGIAANVTLPNTGAIHSLGFSSDIVIDTTSPTIVLVDTSSADGLYGYNVLIPIQIQLSRNVKLAGGNLLVKLNSGATVIVSEINGSIIEVNYLTQEGEQTDDLNVVSLSLSEGASIQDDFGNNLSLSLDSTNISKEHEIKIAAKPQNFILSAIAGENGVISPVGDFPVLAGSTLEVTITPLANFHIAEVLVDGKSVGPASTFIFENIQADHTISASFSANNGFFDITTNATLGGSVSPSGIITVEEGSNEEISIFAETGFHLVEVIVDGVSVGSVDTYQFTNIQSNHHLEAIFAKNENKYLITANKVGQGEITPIGFQEVFDGTSVIYQIVASAGSHIREVLVDDISVGAVDSYTFTNVIDHHEIKAVFEKTKSIYSVAASAIGGGKITPNKMVTISAGGSQSFEFTSEEGYHLVEVFVDGQPQGILSHLELTDVNENHTVEAVFQLTKPAYTMAPSVNNGGNGAIITFAIGGEVPSGSTQTVTVQAEDGFEIVDIKINSVSIKAIDTLTSKKMKQKTFGSVAIFKIVNVQADYLIEVTVEKISDAYLININTEGQGSVNNEKVISVANGSFLPLTFVPADGYHVGDVLVNGKSFGPIEYLGLTNIQTNYLIAVVFSKDLQTYTIGSSVTGKGKITPLGAVQVTEGGAKAYTFEANAGYQLVELIVDDISLKDSTGLATREGFFFSNIKKNHTINAVYKKNATNYKITTKVGVGGTATNSGLVSVLEGSNHFVEVVPDIGFNISDVIVDGQSVGAISAYKFSNVISDHEVEVQFEKTVEAYQIVITSGVGGSATPGAETSVDAGSSLSVEFEPNVGFRVLNVNVDGISLGSINSYLFSNVQKNHSVDVTFVEEAKSYSIHSLVMSSGKLRTLEIVAVEKGGAAITSYKAEGSSQIVDAKVDGVSYGALKSISFANVSEDHQVIFVTELSGSGFYPIDYDPDNSQPGGCQYAPHANFATGLDWWLFFTILFGAIRLRKGKK